MNTFFVVVVGALLPFSAEKFGVPVPGDQLDDTVMALQTLTW